MLLPLPGASVVEVRPALREDLVLVVEFRILGDRNNLGSPRLELSAPLREDHADRLPLLPSHRVANARELPRVESRLCRPVGLDDAFERRSAILWLVRGTADEEIPA